VNNCFIIEPGGPYYLTNNNMETSNSGHGVNEETIINEETKKKKTKLKRRHSTNRQRHYMAVREIEGGLHRSNEPVPWYVIDQDEILRVCWDIASSVLLIILIFWLPYSLTFLADKNASNYLNFDIFVSVWFGIDIILSFFTTYTYYGVKVTHLKRIALRYVMSYFLIDLVATVPWSLILSRTRNLRLGPLAKSAKFPRLLRALRTLRLSKVLRSEFNLPDLSDMFPRVPPVIEQLIKFIAGAVLMNHIFACIWYALGNAPYDEFCTHHAAGDGGKSYPGNRGRRDCSWMQIAGYRPRDGNYFLYTTCLYWSLTTISTVGYGDLVPNRATEKLYASFVMVCGVSWYAVLVSTLGSALQEAATRHGSDHAKTALKQYLYRHRVPPDLSAAIISYLRHHFTIHHQFGDEDSDPEVWRLLKHLNKPLTRSLSLHVGRKAVGRLDFFKNKDETFVADAVAALRAYIASPYETLVPRCTIVTALNLLAHGSCTASSPHYASSKKSSFKRATSPTSSDILSYDDGDDSQHLQKVPPSPAMSLKSLEEHTWTLHSPGDYFGDEGLLLGAAWIEPLITNGWCELQIIPEVSIYQLLTDFPTVTDQLLATANTKLHENPTILTTEFPHPASIVYPQSNPNEESDSTLPLSQKQQETTIPTTRSSSIPPLIPNSSLQRKAVPRRSASHGSIVLTGPPNVHRGLRETSALPYKPPGPSSFLHTQKPLSAVKEDVHNIAALREEISMLRLELHAIREASEYGGSDRANSPSRPSSVRRSPSGGSPLFFGSCSPEAGPLPPPIVPAEEAERPSNTI